MIDSPNMTATSNKEGDMILNGKIKALMVVFQKPRRAKNISIFGEKLSLESIIMSYTLQNFNSSSYWSMTLSSHCKYFALGLGQSWSFLGWEEMANHSLVIGRLNLSGRMKDFVI